MTKKEFIKQLEIKGIKTIFTSRGFLYDLKEANKIFKASELKKFTDEVLTPVGNSAFLQEFDITSGQWGLVKIR